jgi:hypothetical protein
VLLLVSGVVAYIVFPAAGKSAFMSIKKYGFKDTVLVMEKGNLKLAFSRVDEDLYQFVKTAPHVKKMDDEPLVAPYLQMSSVLGKKFLMLRGITDTFYKVRGKSFQIVAGRGLRDKYDILIGYLMPRRLGATYKVGDILDLENRKWKIVGIFRAKGDPAECGALVRMEDFKEVSARGTYSYIEIKADSPQNIPKLTGYVNMAFEMLHDEFPDAPAIMALPEKAYWAELAKMFKMAVMVSKVTALAVVFCALLCIMNISHSAFMKRASDMRVFFHAGVSRLTVFSGLVLEVFAVSVLAGIIGGMVAVAFTGTTVNLQLSTILLQVENDAIVRGAIVGVVLGLLANILPMINLCLLRGRNARTVPGG